MTADNREKAAGYYDLNPNIPQDVPFYRKRIPAPEAHVLELGCGTGLTLVPLASSCGYIHGIDLSDAMLALCQQKLHAAGIPATRAQVERASITSFTLGRTFDLIIAPYRVLQNLETDSQIEGLFECVRHHLRPTGTCILNVFRPSMSPEELRRAWCTGNEHFAWKTSRAGICITCHDRRRRMDPDKLVLYPELIYRQYVGEVLTDETVLQIAMRCFYPEEFAQLIVAHGFRSVARWGGYAGEPYGEGQELVIQFTHGT
jgi:SAM-dependent methyltransferase